MNMKEIYETLYTLPVSEAGYNTGKYFKRKIAITNFEEFEFHINRCNENGWDAYISDYGFETTPDENDTLDTAIIDKIFFDFDTDNPEELPQVEQAMYKFNKQLEDYFQCKNIIIESGAKGYHLYLMLEQPRIISQKVLRSTLEWIQQKFKPEYLDENVVSNPKRLIRIPGSINRKGQKECRILHDDFEPSSYINVIINKQERIIKQEEKILETKMKLQQQKQKVKMMRNENSDKDITNWNVVNHIIEDYYGQGKNVGGDKYIIKCVFHQDSNPSAFYTDKNYFCSACNINVGSYNLLTQYMNKTKEEAIQIIRSYQK